jgi:hypothetical protein
VATTIRVVPFIKKLSFKKKNFFPISFFWKGFYIIVDDVFSCWRLMTRYCHQSVNLFNYQLSQSDRIKRLPPYKELLRVYSFQIPIYIFFVISYFPCEIQRVNSDKTWLMSPILGNGMVQDLTDVSNSGKWHGSGLDWCLTVFTQTWNFCFADQK